MNPALGKDIDRAIRRSKMTNGAIAKAVDGLFSESWVKQTRSGRIDRPPAAKLERLAEVVGGDVRRWLALSSQLGAAPAIAERQASPDVAALVNAVNELVGLLRPIVADRAAQEARLRAVEAELQSLRDRQADGESSTPSSLPETKG